MTASFDSEKYTIIYYVSFADLEQEKPGKIVPGLTKEQAKSAFIEPPPAPFAIVRVDPPLY